MGDPDHDLVLVVEDDHGVAEVLRKRLEAEGYEVHLEVRGGPALKFAAEQRPDLIILDLRLPDLGGYEVCARLRKLYHHWDVPILMLTGMDLPIDELRGFAHGADAYLTKPFDLSELIKTIALLLGKTAIT